MTKTIKIFGFLLLFGAILGAAQLRPSLWENNTYVLIRASHFEDIPLTRFLEFLQTEYNYNQDYRAFKQVDIVQIDSSQIDRRILQQQFDVNFDTLPLLSLADIIGFRFGLVWEVEDNTLRFEQKEVQNNLELCASISKGEVSIRYQDSGRFSKLTPIKKYGVLVKRNGKWSSESVTLEYSVSEEMLYFKFSPEGVEELIIRMLGTGPMVVKHFKKESEGMPGNGSES